MSKKSSYAMKFSNGKTIKFRTKELFSQASEALSVGRFSHVGEMYDKARTCPTGFEYVLSEKKVKEISKKFNTIDFDD